MFAQYRITLKRAWHSTTNIVIAVAFFLLLMGTYFSHYGQQDTTQADLFSAYGTATEAVTKTITNLKKIKNPTTQTKTQLKQKAEEKSYLDQISLAAAGGQNADVDVLNLAVLRYARYALRETRQHPQVALQLIKYQNEPLGRRLIDRKKDVALHTYLYQHHLREIPVAAAKAPATNYLINALVYQLSPLLVIFVFLVWLAEFFTMDRREANINVTNVLPLRKFKVMLAKVGVAGTLSIPLFGLTVLAVYGVIGLNNGWGSFQYPIAYSPDGQHATVILLGQLFLMLIGVFIALFCFFVALSALVSVFAKTMGTVLVIDAIVLLGGSRAISDSHALAGVTRFLPSAYFDYPGLLLHSASWPVFGYAGGIMVLLIGAVLLLGLLGLITHRRQLI